MLCLFEQDFLKYYTKAGVDTEELEVGVLIKSQVMHFISRLDQPHYCLSNRKQLKSCALCQNVAMT